MAPPAGEAAPAAPAPGSSDTSLSEPLDFAALPGWADDDHRAAFTAFRLSAEIMAAAPPKTRALGISGAALQASGRAALSLAGQPAADEARGFFERRFRPRRILATGFVTGYYEPEVEARREPDPRFSVPLYRRPPDLVDVRPDTAPPGWDPEMRFGRRTGYGIVPYLARGEIESGALAGQGLELAWLESPVDAFFIHVQGSARLVLPGGAVMRVAYDGKAGHPYTSIGKLAVQRGLLPLERADKDGLDAWLRAYPEEGRALMHENRSFIFFREVPTLQPEDGPMGAAGVSLTAGRSLAVDRTLMTFHTPVWVSAPQLTDLSDPARHFARLMIAQDTGSAILGPARGDIFVGSGAAAGSLAGKVRHAAVMIVLDPVAEPLGKLQ